MKKFLVAAGVAALALTAAPAAAAPVAASTPATANAKIYKPLVLRADRNLDLGTIVMGTVAAAGEKVTLTAAGGFTCGAGNLTCSGTPVTAQYNVQGSNNAVVRILVGASTLNRSGGGGTVAFTPLAPAPASLTLSNSGAPGDNFNVGGEITILPTTVDGVYSGNMDVTVDY
jgi:opacity protein-like surface antigen